MRFATGFWVSLASSSVFLSSCSWSLVGSAAFPAFNATLTKTAQKSQETGVIQEAFIDSFFIVVPRRLWLFLVLPSVPCRPDLNRAALLTQALAFQRKRTRAYQNNDRPINDGLEQDRLEHGAVSKRRRNGIAFATSTAFPTTSAAIVATIKFAKLARSLLIDVTRRQSRGSNCPVENFLLHRKRDPFFRRVWIGPHPAKLKENILFAFCHPLALE